MYSYTLYLYENNAMNFAVIERHSDWKCAIVDWDLPADYIDALAVLEERHIEPFILDDDPWKYDLETLVEKRDWVLVRR